MTTFGTFRKESSYTKKHNYLFCQFCSCPLPPRKIKFCCKECNQKWTAKNIKVEIRKIHEYKNSGKIKCNQCNSILYGGKRRFCNSQCMNKWNWKNNPKTREKYLKEREIRVCGPREYKYRERDQFKKSCRAYTARHVQVIECRYCGVRDNLQRHHTKGYKGKSIDGVVVACSKCHSKKHRNIV